MKLFCKFLVLVFFLITFLSCKTVSYAQIYTNDKLITVDLSRQMLYMWEGGKIISQTLVSTGLPYTPTVKGTFRIYWKLPQQNMTGNSRWYGYYNLKNVPSVMYFYQGYAIHGAYWHYNFGRRASHGCINVPPAVAKWMYDWASTGTMVYIY